MIREMAIDNLGICRFHRAWAEDMIPEIMEKLFGMKDQYLEKRGDYRRTHQFPQCSRLLGIG